MALTQDRQNKKAESNNNEKLSENDRKQSQFIKKFCTRFDEALKEKPITQTELSKAAGVSQTLMSHHQNGNRAPTLETACIIARELDVSLDWLCGLDEERSTEKSSDKKMLELIASIIKDDNSPWTIIVNVIEKFEGETETTYGEEYSAAICTKNNRFYNFINRYREVIRMGNDIKDVRGLDSDIAENMATQLKKSILDEYTEILEKERSAKK